MKVTAQILELVDEARRLVRSLDGGEIVMPSAVWEEVKREHKEAGNWFEGESDNGNWLGGMRVRLDDECPPGTVYVRPREANA